MVDKSYTEFFKCNGMATGDLICRCRNEFEYGKFKFSNGISILAIKKWSGRYDLLGIVVPKQILRRFIFYSQ